MNSEALETYLHQHIPMSRMMEVSVISADTQSIQLRAPLEPNINHRDTVFGGSASALGILAAWSLLHVRLLAEDIQAKLVVQRNTMEYDLPMEDEFTARATLFQAETWPRFTRMLNRRGKARTSVISELECRGQTTGRLIGEFVALKAPDTRPTDQRDGTTSV